MKEKLKLVDKVIKTVSTTEYHILKILSRQMADTKKRKEIGV